LNSRTPKRRDLESRASSPNSALLCGIGHALLPLRRELKTTLFRLLILSSQHATGTYISLDKLPLRLQLMRHQAPQLEKARASRKTKVPPPSPAPLCFRTRKRCISTDEGEKRLRICALALVLSERDKHFFH
jgi:hypothetical protein